MGRGTDPRNALLGKQKNRGVPQILLLKEKKNGVTRRYYADHDGQPINRTYEERDSWVEQINDGDEAITIYRYPDDSVVPKQDCENIVVRRIEESPGVSKEKFLYTDDTLVIRGIGSHDIPVMRTKGSTGEGVFYQHLNGGSIIHREKLTDGTRREKRTYRNGKLDAFYPNASEEIMESGGFVKRAFHRNGKYHRGDGLPAIIEYDKDEKEIVEIYYEDGEFHRDGRPAVIDQKTRPDHILYVYWTRGQAYNPTGDAFFILRSKETGLLAEERFSRKIIIEDEEHVIPGKDNCGPAIIEYFDDGETVRSELWYNYEDEKAAIKHSGKPTVYPSNDENTPAKIVYDEGGAPEKVEYWVDGRLHRTDGPAIITYSDNTQQEAYYLDGKVFSGRNDWEEALKQL